VNAKCLLAVVFSGVGANVGSERLANIAETATWIGGGGPMMTLALHGGNMRAIGDQFDADRLSRETR
jgi:hypothetical protein